MDAEIGIVGAGPAGARAAELLSRSGADVWVWDDRVPWEKPCGGGLPASAFDHMPELRRLREKARKVEAVRFEASEGRGFPVRLKRPMYVVSRRDLSRFQLDRATGAGARWIDEGVRRIERLERGWRLEGGSGRSWTVRRIVGADGAASLVRRVASPGLRVELAPTRVSYPGGAGTAPGTALVRFFEEVDGYFWDFSRPDHRSVGAGVEPGRWNRRRLDEEIDRYLGEPRDEEAFGARAGAVIGTAARGHGSYEAVGGPDFALLGDAAGFADPATGEGIQNAFRSAGHLAEAYEPRRGFRSYPARVRASMAAEFDRSRLLRKVLFDRGVGSWLVRAGEGNRWARALVSSVMNSTNEHDLTVPGLLRRSAVELVA